MISVGGKLSASSCLSPDFHSVNSKDRVIALVAMISGGVTWCEADEPVATLADVTVIAARLPIETPGTRLWDTKELESSNTLTLDALLAKDPAFSLYRRQSALFGNPTSAGVSLRRTGATATSRSLVLRDGIPQNDPFGGWISWSRYDSSALKSARLVPAAGATVWGNQSPAGTVQLTSRTPERTGGVLRTTLGNHNTWSMSSVADFVSGDGAFALQANAHILQSDGFHVLQKRQRGPVDRPIDLDARGLDLRALWRRDDTVTVESTLSMFKEERGNGTKLARNASEAVDASIRVTQETESVTWQATGYYQQRDFAALFSAVDEDHTFETPALDQFDVPGTGWGGGLTSAWKPNDQFDLMLGIDVRHLQGETNENAGFVDGAFLRRRKAGGRETFAGAFARADIETGSGLRLEASARMDYWSLTNGRRVERRPVTGALLRDDPYSDRDGLEPSFGITILQDVGDSLTLSASVSSSFRAPTLNELYRPFRVRSDITEANPLLDPERFLSIDVEAAWTPDDNFHISGAFFAHWIDDAIANVPITDPVRAADLDVFVPPGGSLRQRDNIDRARVFGFDMRATWSPNDFFAVSLAYQWTDTRFIDSNVQPLLEDHVFPQSPGHQAHIRISTRPIEHLELFTATSYTSKAFDDAFSTRPLDAYWSTLVGLEFEVNDHLTVRAMVDNVFDEEIQTGLSSNGLLAIGTPRSCWISASVDW